MRVSRHLLLGASAFVAAGALTVASGPDGVGFVQVAQAEPGGNGGGQGGGPGGAQGGGPGGGNGGGPGGGNGAANGAGQSGGHGAGNAGGHGVGHGPDVAGSGFGGPGHGFGRGADFGNPGFGRSGFDDRGFGRAGFDDEHDFDHPGLGRGAVASALGGLNAAHASQRAMDRAAPNSMVGRVDEYSDRMENELDEDISVQRAHDNVVDRLGAVTGRLGGLSDRAVAELADLLGLDDNDLDEW